MTREEAIDIIKCLAWYTRPNEEDIEQAIKALQQDPCEDAISRQAAIDVIERWLECSDYNEAERHIMGATESILYDLPSVKPQEPAYCDRNICIKNEYNGISCDECEVTKSQEPNTVIATGDGAYYRIKALEQEPKTGHWFVDERPESNREVICSNCEQSVFKYHKLDFDYRPMYCPNCGCRMVEPQESEG